MDNCNASQQEYLMARRPDFIQNAEYRRQCLHELAYLRELRQESRQLLALASHIPHFNGDNTASVNIGPLPQSPMGKGNAQMFCLLQDPKSNDSLIPSHTYVSSPVHSSS